MAIIFYLCTALRLFGSIEIKPLRGFLMATAFNLRTTQFWALLPSGRDTAQHCLYGVVEIKPLGGFLMVTADNHYNYFMRLRAAAAGS